MPRCGSWKHIHGFGMANKPCSLQMVFSTAEFILPLDGVRMAPCHFCILCSKLVPFSAEVTAAKAPSEKPWWTLMTVTPFLILLRLERDWGVTIKHNLEISPAHQYSLWLLYVDGDLHIWTSSEGTWHNPRDSGIVHSDNTFLTHLLQRPSNNCWKFKASLQALHSEQACE